VGTGPATPAAAVSVAERPPVAPAAAMPVRPAAAMVWPSLPDAPSVSMAVPAPALPDVIASVGVRVAQVLDRAADWANALPASPLSSFLSGALLLVRRTVVPGVPVIPAVTVTNTLVAEGAPGTQTEAVFTVSLGRAYDSAVSVGYATTPVARSPLDTLAGLFGGPPADNPATAGTDYIPASGVLTFAPGQTSQQVRVAVLGDTVAESAETFGLTTYAALPTPVSGSAAAVNGGSLSGPIIRPAAATSTRVALSSGKATITDANKPVYPARQWVELKDSSWDSPVRRLIPYGDGFVVGLDNGAVQQWTGSTWQELHGPWGGSGGLTAMLPDAPGFVVGFFNGSVQQWTGPGGTWKQLRAPLNYFADDQDLSGPTLYFQVRPMISADGGFVIGSGDRVWQWLDSGYWSRLKEGGWNSNIYSMIRYGSGVVVGLGNGAVQQWTGSTWRELHDEGWKNSAGTMIPYRDGFVVGLGNGAVQQWTGSTWQELHDDGWGSEVKTMIPYRDGFVVGLGNGAVQQWTGTQWNELHGVWVTGTGSEGSPLYDEPRTSTLIPYGDGFVFGPGNGSIQQWTGTQWNELHNANWGDVSAVLPYGEGFVVGLYDGSVAYWTGPAA
jgi:hypothetical protein